MADPFEELGPLVAQRRAELNYSLRDAAAESGVPSATLGRVEQGRMPDLETFRKIVDWLGISPDRFFTVNPRAENTPDLIVEHLRDDPSLSPEAVEKLDIAFRGMYDALAARDASLAVHLRAAKTFHPAALGMLTELLDDIQGAIELRDAS